MQSKDVLYAAVGAPVVAARKVGEAVTGLKERVAKAPKYGALAERLIGEWAAEGEKLVGRIGDAKMVDELAAKVDLDQAKEQVVKLRDQLEEMLATWKASFRPVTQPEAMPAAETAAKTTKAAAPKTTAKTKTPEAKTAAPKTAAPDSTKTADKTA